MLKQIPNILTITRLALIAPFIMLLFQQEYTYALCIFFIAGFTDGLDGWLARYFNWQSLLGTFIDPMADKALIVSSFISLASIGKLPWWLVGLVFLRDLAISCTAFWFWRIQGRHDFIPTFLSKINTFLQLMLITLCLYELASGTVFLTLNHILVMLTTATTTITFIDYAWTWGKRTCDHRPVL